jgi:hypothetical protein
MPPRITYVTALDLNGLPTKPLKQGKRSNALANFKLETMSPSPSKIGGSCLRPQRSSFGAIMEKIKYLYGVDEEFMKSATFISVG